MPEMPVGAGQAEVQRAAAETLALRTRSRFKRLGAISLLETWPPDFPHGGRPSSSACWLDQHPLFSPLHSLSPRILLKSTQSHPRRLQAYFVWVLSALGVILGAQALLPTRSVSPPALLPAHQISGSTCTLEASPSPPLHTASLGV